MISLARPATLTLALLSATLTHAAPPDLSLSKEGVVINAHDAGKFTLPPPGLSLGPQDYSGEKPVSELSGNTLVAKYPSGAEVKVTVSPTERSAQFSWSNVPAKAASFIFNMHLPIRLANGGKYALGKKPLTDFPELKEKQVFSDGWAESFTLVDPSGAGFVLKTPGNYQQLQDNRVFNWAVFAHIYHFRFSENAGKQSITFRFEDLNSATAATAQASSSTPKPKSVLVDRYGQSMKKDYPGKVKTDEELKADLAKPPLPVAKGPELDMYGGLAGSQEKYGLKATGYFHVGQADGRQVLVTPLGNVFFQLGVCGIASTDDFTTVKGREGIYEWLPKAGSEFDTAWRDKKPEWGVFSFYIANWIRKYNRPFTVEEWTGQVVERLRSWGFNSAGAFSSNSEAMKSRNFPNVSFLPLGKGDGVVMLPDKIGATEILDPFVPGTEEALEKRFAKSVAGRANDPLLIGYFLTNEPHFELLPKKIPTYKASTVAAKRKLVERLQEKYKTIEAFNTAWQPAKASPDFEALKEEPLFVRTKEGAQDMQEFYQLYMDTYYSMADRLFRKYDPNHILIGARLTPGTATNETAVRAGGKIFDVVSVNYYTYPIEAGFLKRVHEWSGGKPIILSEWYYSSTDQGLGAGKEVKSQKDRGLGYRNYVEQSAALPFVVGSQWFIYGDQSLTGRFFEGFNGEGNNTGLINVADRPYEELVLAAAETHAGIFDVMFGKKKAYVFNDPRFVEATGGNRIVAVPKALPGFQFDGSTTNWPGRPAEPIESSRVVLGNPDPAVRGDFRLCWDTKELHFLIQVKDPTPGQNKKEGASLWSADGIELFVGAREVSTPGSMIYSDRQILLGAGEKPLVHIVDHADESGRCRILVNKEVSGDGYVLQFSMPWEILGVTPTPNMELLFDVAIDNSDDGTSRKQQLVWNGTSKNSSDRGAWGRARIVEN